MERTLDIENHALNQNPTIIKFFELVPPEYDSEITENSILAKNKEDSNVDNISSEFQTMKLITIGCNKGSIVFVSLKNLSKIRTRLTYHRESIISIETFQTKANKGYILASMCIENYLRFVRFEEDRALCYLTIFCGNSLKFMRGF